ncbi:peptidase C65 Otubain-domain-containing protein [Lipomyces oligophaga]|uniref:peptidase C65 Otubain-domain-containing protein n=1 Tax=Lipomyces oligophaga TaxID=45792 RepID=UPI0034CD94FD
MPELNGDDQDAKYDENELDDITIMRLTQEIKDQEASKLPLLGNWKPIEVLLNEYEDQTFKTKIQALCGGSAGYRQVRGDGNCAWRAFAFRYFELIKNSPLQELEVFEKSFNDKKQLLDAAGYEENGYIDFLEECQDLFKRTKTPGDQDMEAEFNNMEVSSAVIVYLRLLAAAYVKTHAEDYLPFIFDGESTSIDDYCSRNIEAFSVEADHLALTALVNALETVELGVVYMDRSAGEEASVHTFEPMKPLEGQRLLRIDLLYRPGHYDVFYR